MEDAKTLLQFKSKIKYYDKNCKVSLLRSEQNRGNPATQSHGSVDSTDSRAAEDVVNDELHCLWMFFRRSFSF